MGHLLFVAVGTLGKRVLRQGIMSTPGRGSFLRVAPFWIRHGKFLTELAGASKIKLRYIPNPWLEVVTPAILLCKPVNAATSPECL
jgi:hypothetical protein